MKGPAWGRGWRAHNGCTAVHTQQPTVHLPSTRFPPQLHSDRRLAMRTQRTRSGYAPSLRATLPLPSEELWEATPRDTPTPSGSAALDAPTAGAATAQGGMPRSGSAGGGLASVPEV